MTKVLVVDDSAVIRSRCKRIITDHGMTYLGVDNGKDALRTIDRENPDIVLLDVVMPEMDGFDVLRKIKAGRHKNIPVIMITIKSADKEVVEGLTLGADDYVPKPFEPNVLIARIRAMVRMKNINDELVMQNRDLKKINKELKDANKTIESQARVALVGQLMVGIHHELRNPLAAALSDSQILKKYYKFDEDSQYFVYDIESQLQQMKNILNNIKDMDEVDLEEYIEGVMMVKLKKGD